MTKHPSIVIAAALVALGLSWGHLEAQGVATATLSVLSQPVERIPSGGAGREPASDGMNLAAGDRVRTGPAGTALVTFLDGSTVTVLPGSEVTVRQTERQERSGIRLLIHAGRVWARVARAAGRWPGLTLESNEYAATAHDGLIGAEQAPGGAFVCWTRRGELRLTDSIGQSVAMLTAGQRARALLGQPVTPEPFRPSASTLEVRIDGPAAPLLRMPDGGVAVGFLARDVEVNQVFGSLTEQRGRETWIVEVPGGEVGPYTLVLTGGAAGSFKATVTARYGGFAVYRQDLTGTIDAGQRLYTRITQGVDGRDPRSARVIDGRFEGWRAWDGSEPAEVVSSPGRRAPGLN